MSIFRRQQRFFPLFLLAAVKSALSILTVKYHVLTAPCLSVCTNVRNIQTFRRNTTWQCNKFIFKKRTSPRLCSILDTWHRQSGGGKYSFNHDYDLVVGVTYKTVQSYTRCTRTWLHCFTGLRSSQQNELWTLADWRITTIAKCHHQWRVWQRRCVKCSWWIRLYNKHTSWPVGRAHSIQADHIKQTIWLQKRL